MFIPGLRVNAVARISNTRKAIRSSRVFGSVLRFRDTVSPGRILIVFFFLCRNEASKIHWTDKLQTILSEYTLRSL